MKRTNLCKALVTLVLLIVTTSSCKKILNNSASSNFGAGTQRTFYYTDFPDVVDGRLSFRDSTHFVEYKSFLDSIMHVPDTSDTTSDQDEDYILSIVEGEYEAEGFQSCRSVALAAFETANVTGWSSLELIPEIHFIYDKTMRSILNQYNEVIIDGVITHVINAHWAVTIPATADNAVLMEIQGLSETAEVGTIFDIDPDLKIIDLLAKKTTVTGVTTKTASMQLEYGQPIYPDPCNDPYKIEIPRINTYDPPIHYDADYDIYWGDGTSDLQVPSTQGLLSIQHTYTLPGYYTVTIKSTPNGFSIVAAEKDISIYIQNTSCGYSLGASSPDPGTWFNTGAGWAIRAKSWIYNGASSANSIASRTESFEWSNGKWHERKAPQIQAEIVDLETYNNSNCGFIGYQLASNSPLNCKSVCVIRNPGQNFGWYQYLSRHRIKTSSNGSWYTYSMTLYNCE